MRNGLRIFIAIWYLLGWMSHVYLGLYAPQVYTAFGDTTLCPAFTRLWQSFFMPHITFFALLLAGFELLVGCLLIGQGRQVKMGLALSLLFNLFLVQMGLGYPAAEAWQSFLVNRLPNLLYMALQVPLLWGWDDLSLVQSIKGYAASRAA